MPIPNVVIQRLPVYLRCIKLLLANGEAVTSSQAMALSLGLSSAQIRKDLSYFGEFGRQGMGYDLEYLRQQLERILHVDRVWPVILVGAGALGEALAHYRGFVERGFEITAIFDSDPSKIGQPLGGLQIEPIQNLNPAIQESGARVAILAVPASAAQEVAERLVAAGIRAILNYAPVSLSLPAHIQVQYIDPAASLQSMAYYLEPG